MTRTKASLLEGEHVTIRFGGVTALDDASLRVNAGEIVGLIGPNGAGKTTFFNCVTGVLKPDTGRVTFDGVDVGALPPHRRSRLGMARKVVVLPAPLSPSRATISPSPTLRSIPKMTGSRPYPARRPETSNSAAI